MEKFIWDSQLPVFTLRGEDSRNFLHGQTTTDIINARRKFVPYLLVDTGW